VKPLRTGALAGALAIVAIVPGSAAREAGAAPKYRSELIELLVDVTATSHIDWTYASDHLGDPDTSWQYGVGEQLIRYTTSRPVRLHAMTTNGAYGTPKLLIHGRLRPGRARAVVQRTAAMTQHDPPPACEGGGCGDARRFEVPQRCGRRTLRTGPADFDFEPRSGSLEVEIPASSNGVYKACAPDSERVERPLMAASFAVPVWQSERIRGLETGDRVTLRGRANRPWGCIPPSVKEDTFEKCETATIKLVVRRVK